MSVDPFIQSPTSTQSVNPYSYIMNNPLAGTDPTGYACEAATGSHICKSEVKATVTKEGTTAKVHLTGGTTKQQQAVVNAIANGASKMQSSTPASVKTQDLNGQGQIANKGGSSAKDAADNTGKMMTGASIVTAGLEQTKDLALLNTAGTGTALMATGSTGNAWALSKNAKSNLVAASLDGSKLASKLSPQVTLVGLLASGVSSAMDEDVTFTEAIVKSGVDASMALVGLRGGGVGTALSIGYSVVDVTYPGGWIQANKDANRGISQFSKEIDTHNIQKGWREDPVNTMKQIFGVPVIKL